MKPGKTFFVKQKRELLGFHCSDYLIPTLPLKSSSLSASLTCVALTNLFSLFRQRSPKVESGCIFGGGVARRGAIYKNFHSVFTKCQIPEASQFTLFPEIRYDVQ